MKRPEARDAQAKALDARLRAFALEHGIPPSRARRWVSYMAFGSALARASQDTEDIFTIKGGVALELRMGSIARATRDIDVIVDGATTELIRSFERVLTHAYEGFGFARRGAPHVMRNDIVRVDVAITYYGAPWATIQVDLSATEGGITEVEFVDVLPVAMLALTAPGQIPCLSLRYQIAQKLHALTAPVPEGRSNDRFRDLVDLLLLMPLLEDLTCVRTACVEVFATRATHAWPPQLVAWPEWKAPFAELARETNLAITDIAMAIAEVEGFIGKVDQS
ncbi:MAG TPA: nucleotidyl transferase AbiEii/AbiGii toxin family protein [Gemmatimonadaceae bacterium]|nr:nucleotidyl transferase AbiEii/AbiGii toxin family protein [Gemmatimonadaceae bacterium]